MLTSPSARNKKQVNYSPTASNKKQAYYTPLTNKTLKKLKKERMQTQ